LGGGDKRIQKKTAHKIVNTKTTKVLGLIEKFSYAKKDRKIYAPGKGGVFLTMLFANP